MNDGPGFASSPAIRQRMQKQARKHTDLEVLVRKELHRRGLRYRLQVRLLPRYTADIVFPKAKVVVDVRSCFWHHCPEHGSIPKANSDWWHQKFARTVERDAQVEKVLVDSGWTVVIVWQHDVLMNAAEHIYELVKA